MPILTATLPKLGRRLNVLNNFYLNINIVIIIFWQLGQQRTPILTSLGGLVTPKYMFEEPQEKLLEKVC